MKLVNIREITGRIELKSGLHIGAGDLEMRIGGTDNPVVKHPHTNEPYIPGSSLKGKVRSLLEIRSGLMRVTDGSPLSARDLNKESVTDAERKEGKKILALFGTSGADGDEAADLGPTRVSFADCCLSETSREMALSGHLPLTEVKSENSIDRIRGTAKNPRFTERVPAGLAFDFTITLKEMDGDDDLFPCLLSGLKLLEHDALGGSGSRGYGRVEIDFNDPEIKKTFNDLPLFAS